MKGRNKMAKLKVMIKKMIQSKNHNKGRSKNKSKETTRIKSEDSSKEEALGGSKDKRNDKNKSEYRSKSKQIIKTAFKAVCFLFENIVSAKETVCRRFFRLR